MIVSRTPLRISFVGGGSDFPSFYKQSTKGYGAVISTTINKYIYITVNKKFDEKIRASYSITETVDRVSDLKQELIRESLKTVGINRAIEITSIADVPSGGTGLGSSSAYTVGVLNALYAFKGKFCSAEKLAQEAYIAEAEKAGKPAGKQDHYISAYGGLNYIQFNSDGTVFVEPIIMKEKTKRNIERSLLLLYTGTTRNSSKILKEQNNGFEDSKKKREIMYRMVEITLQMKKVLNNSQTDRFGDLLHENWMLKAKLVKGITDFRIDNWYRIARKNGALGGKICGAGGGGFLLLYAPRSKHRKIVSALPRLKPFDFSFEPQGSRIIFAGT